MRKALKILAISILALAVTSCSILGLPSLRRFNNFKTVNEALSSGDVGTAAAVHSIAPTETAKAQASPDGTPNPNRVVRINEQVLYDKDKVRITAKSQSIKHKFSVDIFVLIENNSNRSITVGVPCAAINGIMVETVFYCDVAAGKKANNNIMFMDVNMNDLGIKTIRDIDLVFSISDADSYDMEVESDTVHIQTDANPQYVQPVDGSGFVALERDNIKVVARKLNASAYLGYYDLLLYIENNSTADVTVYARDVSANGFMMNDAFFMCRLMPGKKALDSIAVSVEELKRDDIKVIEYLELAFQVSDARSDEDLFLSDNIKLVFNK